MIRVRASIYSPFSPRVLSTSEGQREEGTFLESMVKAKEGSRAAAMAASAESLVR